MRESDRSNGRSCASSDLRDAGSESTTPSISMTHQQILASVLTQTRQQQRRRAVRLATDALMSRLFIDPYGDGLVLLLGRSIHPTCNRDAIEHWVDQQLDAANDPDVDGLSRRLRDALDDATGDVS